MSPYDPKHYVTPRSYREATGKFYKYEEPDLWERRLWRWVLIFGYCVVALLLLGFV